MKLAKLLFFPILICSILLQVACIKQTDYLATTKIDSPKEVVLDAANTPWRIEIEKKLRKMGFKVLRKHTTKKRIQVASDTENVDSNEASTRYVLDVDANYYKGAQNRCLGGGFNFSYISASLVDTENNETLATYSNSGYSENCPPMSGTIFYDVAKMVSNVWEGMQ